MGRPLGDGHADADAWRWPGQLADDGGCSGAAVLPVRGGVPDAAGGRAFDAIQSILGGGDAGASQWCGQCVFARPMRGADRADVGKRRDLVGRPIVGGGWADAGWRCCRCAAVRPMRIDGKVAKLKAPQATRAGLRRGMTPD